MFTGYTIPIYYEDGHIGHADEWTATRIATGAFKFGAKLSPEHQRRFCTMARKPKVTTQALKLVEALTFLKVATERNTGEYAFQGHLRFVDKFVVANDGQISAGHPVEEELACVPHAKRLMEAVTKCGKSLSIAELDTGRLSVKGDNLRALVPCLNTDAGPHVKPDPPIVPITDEIRKGFECVGSLVSEAGNDVIEASVLLQGGSIMATNKKVLLEYWHGIDLPPGMVLPKAFVAAVLKVQKPLAQFGCQQEQNEVTGAWRVKFVTFYFDDGSWIRSQTYDDAYPELGNVMNSPSYPVDTPAGLFDAIDACAPFHPLEHVYFAENKVMSHMSEETGAQYDVAGLPAGKTFEGKVAMKVKAHVKTIDLTTYHDRAFFFGEPGKVRGLLMAVISNTHDAG